jgi:X-X-X-Leu-X-X-Gly heptad repeat protein
MAEKISVQIALEGGEEIKRQLADIGTAGQKAFADLARAADQAGTFKALNPADITNSLQKFGVTGVEAISKVQAAVASAVRLEQVVGAVDTLTRAFRGLGAVGGVVVRDLSTEITRLGTGLARSLGPLAGVSRALGPIGLAAGALAGGTVALVRFASAAEDTAKALTQLQAITGQSFTNLSALQNVFAQGGTTAKDFASQMTSLTNRVADVGQQKKIEDAGQEWTQLANGISNLRDKFNNLANGATAAFSPLTTLDSKVKALLQSVAQAQAGDQLGKLADIFRSLSDLDRARIGGQLGFSPEAIRTLSLGSAGMRQMTADVRALGIALDVIDQKNLQTLIQSQNQAGALFDGLRQKIGALAAPAIASFWNGFTNQIRELVPQFSRIGDLIGRMDFSSLGAAAANFLLTLAKIAEGWAAIFSGNAQFGQAISNAFAQIGPLLVGVATQLGLAMGQGLISGIISAIQSAAGSIFEAIKGALGIGGGGAAGAPSGGESGFAAGGLLGGSGTGTSDSNLAWVSRGEFIMPARAVSQPGVLQLLEQLRRGALNFAMGGLVPRPGMIPAFANGGLTGGMSNVTIQFPGAPEISGLRASATTVNQMRHEAAMAQVRSGGRKPSRYS